MNIVFWLFVIISVAALWCAMSPIFGQLGEYFIGMINRAKNSMETYENEEKEKKK